MPISGAVFLDDGMGHVAGGKREEGIGFCSNSIRAFLMAELLGFNIV